ncbi:hypothetical protein BDW59DRAFT_165402 [Aspergillus cavernicola]|uniref:Ser-Thr-rich glycosyl-phosphatidyl-inositol-anchored membrane family-domain-containing protein n=1 Tax=Aspergillus cavernicola TaxID=176166 RepID=A0ABR4HVN0_9EURO
MQSSRETALQPQRTCQTKMWSPLLHFRLLSCLFIVSVQAQDTITSAPAPGPSTPAILRPSSGETVTVGEPYTISWTPPPPPDAPLAIELFGKVGYISGILPETTSCDGWLINTECDKFNITIPSGATSYVWNVTPPYDHFWTSSTAMSFRLGVYPDILEYAELPETEAPWYMRAEFVLTQVTTTSTTRSTSTSTSMTTTTTGSTATTSASTTVPGEPDTTSIPSTTTGGSPAASEVPTDMAVPLLPGVLGGWNIALLMGGGWMFFAL